MSRSLWLGDVVRDAFRGVKGVQVDEIADWEQRGRPVADHQGVIDHHTGKGSYHALLRYMAWGSSISPLCNIATSRPENGIVRVTIVASGKANHAGVGYLPWTGHNNGNARAIGIEHQNTGYEPWPTQQLDAARRLDAALLNHMGVGTDRLADHKTYTDRKWDRHTIDIAAWRHEVEQVNFWEEPMPERYYEQAVIGHNAVDLEAGRILASHYGLGLIQVDGKGAMTSVTHPGYTAKVGYGFVVGKAREMLTANFPIGQVSFWGSDRDETAKAIGQFIEDHPKKHMHREGEPWNHS